MTFKNSTVHSIPHSVEYIAHTPPLLHDVKVGGCERGVC